MKSLITLQETFQAALLNKMTKLDFVVATAHVSVETRLGIYIHAYTARLKEALAYNYPILYQWLGEKKFHQLALKYINHFPSRFSSIRWFGDRFALFLQKETNSLAYAEMANFEWYMSEVFDAKNAKKLTFKKMQKLTPDLWANVSFKMHPSLRRIDLSWNVIAIWLALTDGINPPKLKKYKTRIPWVLWRKSFINQFYSLTPEEAWSIDALIKGETFGHICAGLCKWMNEEEVGGQAAFFLRNWIEAGLISEVVHNV